jgi:hypothetical protein
MPCKNGDMAERYDWIERAIRQIAEALGHALKLAAGGRAEEAERVLDEAWASQSGLRRADLRALDDASLIALLGPKAALAARVLEAEAVLAESRGALEEGARLRRRAEELARRL